MKKTVSRRLMPTMRAGFTALGDPKRAALSAREAGTPVAARLMLARAGWLGGLVARTARRRGPVPRGPAAARPAGAKSLFPDGEGSGFEGNGVHPGAQGFEGALEALRRREVRGHGGGDAGEALQHLLRGPGLFRSRAVERGDHAAEGPDGVRDRARSAGLIGGGALHVARHLAHVFDRRHDLLRAERLLGGRLLDLSGQLAHLLDGQPDGLAAARLLARGRDDLADAVGGSAGGLQDLLQ